MTDFWRLGKAGLAAHRVCTGCTQGVHRFGSLRLGVPESCGTGLVGWHPPYALLHVAVRMLFVGRFSVLEQTVPFAREARTVRLLNLNWCVAIGCAALMSFGAAHSLRAEDHPVSEASEPQSFLYPLSKLTTQESRPFRIAKGVLTRDMGAWRVYGKWVRRYPSAVKCLEDGAINDGTADLLRLNWRKLSPTALSVCLFRIMTTINDPKASVAWFRAHGFKVLAVKHGVTANVDPDGDLAGVRRISGSWTVPQFRERHPVGWLVRLHGIDPVSSVSAQVVFDEGGVVDRTQFRANMN